MSSNKIPISVCYATSDSQRVIELDAAADEPPLAVIQRSGILEQFPELKADELVFGVYGKKWQEGSRLFEHDRIEIYRPLQLSPTEARRLRAQRAKDKAAAEAD